MTIVVRVEYWYPVPPSPSYRVSDVLTSVSEFFDPVVFSVESSGTVEVL